MHIALRDYQAQIVENVLAAISREQKFILVVMPTGTGKSIVASAIVANLQRTESLIYVVCDR